MMGAIIGDIVGSRLEWENIKSKDFELFTADCAPTDDSIMTLAIAKAILECNANVDMLGEESVLWMQRIGRRYPACGYGGSFIRWIYSEDPQPYNSLGNGAAMRVSAVAWAARTPDECVRMSRAVTEVSHNHPEGIKGAEAIAVATFMALHGGTKDEIKAKMAEYYDIDFALDSIRDQYAFDVTCMGTVPPAIVAFLEATGYEDAIRNAISIGGDSDTLAACTGAIAEAYYGIPVLLREQAKMHMDKFLRLILADFEKAFPPKLA